MKKKTLAGVLAPVAFVLFFVLIMPAAAAYLEWSRLGRLVGESGPEPYVNVIAAHPTDPLIIYVGTLLTTDEAALVYRSDDGGASWQPASIGLPTGLPLNTGVNDLILLPNAPDVLYAGLDTGIWRSDDGGTNWLSAAGGSIAAGEKIIALDVAPGASPTIYALTPDGVHVSSGGAPWVKRNSGLPPSDTVIFNDLAVDLTAPETAYVATNPAGVYRTNKGGQGWVAVNNNLPDGPRNVRAVAVAPTTGEVFISLRGAGLFRSDNDGSSWTLSHAGITYDTTLFGSIERPVFSPTDPTIAYVHNSDGVFRSEDGGGTWLPAPEGFTDNVLVSALAFQAARPQMIYAGTSASGVWNFTATVGRYFVPVIAR
jgi:photosystem II stability/assembly factor-like uncharacterized protein